MLMSVCGVLLKRAKGVFLQFFVKFINKNLKHVKYFSTQRLDDFMKIAALVTL